MSARASSGPSHERPQRRQKTTKDSQIKLNYSNIAHTANFADLSSFIFKTKRINYYGSRLSLEQQEIAVGVMHIKMADLFRGSYQARVAIVGLLALACAAAAAGDAAANELGGNTSWQFRTPADRQVSIGTVDLINRYNGNYYQQWNNSYTYNTYNSSSSVVNGDQTNCSLSSSATGNSGSTSGYASTSSPSILSNPSTGATAAGNQTSGSSAGSAGTTTAPLNSVQDSYGSPVGAAVTGTVSSAGVGQLNSGSSSSSQILNSTQSATSSPSVSNVSGSSACAGVGGRRSSSRSR